MLKWLCEHYKGEIHVSLGMTTHEEEEKLVNLFETYGRSKDLVLYVCTSGYPVPFENVCLLELERVISTYGKRIKEVAFSGHHLGIAVDLSLIHISNDNGTPAFLFRTVLQFPAVPGADQLCSYRPLGY